MKKNYLLLAAASFALSACACDKSTIIQPIQKKDKQLTCSELVLEINEAEHYMQKADEDKLLKLDYIVSPLCYVPTFASADEAKKSAADRLDYLNQIYTLNNCENAPSGPSVRPPPFPGAKPGGMTPLPPPTMRNLPPPVVRTAPPPPPPPGFKTSPAMPLPQVQSAPLPPAPSPFGKPSS